MISSTHRPPPPLTQEPLFTRNFLFACLANLMAFASFYFLLATLPVYIVTIGGSESEVGFIIGVFAATALAFRPLVGGWADRWNRRGLILGGALLMFLSSLLYTLTHSTPSLLAVRALHGAGFALFSTALATLVADILPQGRRGEGMGYYGMAVNLAMVVGPALGVALYQALGFTILFLCGAGVALLSLLASSGLREPHREGPSGGAAPSLTLLEPSALFPATIMGLFALTYGSLVSFLPIYAMSRGVTNPGLFFSTFAVVLILSRSPAGWLSDRYGRASTILPGLALTSGALGLLSWATSWPHFLLAAALYGLAFAAVQPSLMALAVDRVSPLKRGAAMGTFSASMDLGIGGGSFLWGFVAQGFGFPAMFLGAAGVGVMGMAVFLLGARQSRGGKSG